MGINCLLVFQKSFSFLYPFLKPFQISFKFKCIAPFHARVLNQLLSYPHRTFSHATKSKAVTSKRSCKPAAISARYRRMFSEKLCHLASSFKHLRNPCDILGSHSVSKQPKLESTYTPKQTASQGSSTR